MNVCWSDAYEISRAADTLAGYCQTLASIWQEGESWQLTPERARGLGLAFAHTVDTSDVWGRQHDTSADHAARRARVRAAREALQCLVQSLRASGLLRETPEADE